MSDSDSTWGSTTGENSTLDQNHKVLDSTYNQGVVCTRSQSLSQKGDSDSRPKSRTLGTPNTTPRPWKEMNFDSTDPSWLTSLCWEMVYGGLNNIWTIPRWLDSNRWWHSHCQHVIMTLFQKHSAHNVTHSSTCPHSYTTSCMNLPSRVAMSHLCQNYLLYQQLQPEIGIQW